MAKFDHTVKKYPSEEELFTCFVYLYKIYQCIIELYTKIGILGKEETKSDMGRLVQGDVVFWDMIGLTFVPKLCA